MGPTQLTRLSPRCQKHELAYNEEDGKKIRLAEKRAEKAFKSTTSKRPINESSSLSCPSSSSRFSSQYSRLSSLSFGSFRNQRDQLSYPRSPRQGPVIVSSAAGLAIGGPNAVKSPALFLKVFQLTHDKTVTNKVILNFHLFLLRAISLRIYQRIPCKKLRALGLSLRSQL